MREAAANLEFEEAARLHDEVKMVDLEFANDMLTGAGETVDKAAPKRLRGEAQERFTKGRP
jgi:excinuclease ABC subunit B